MKFKEILIITGLVGSGFLLLGLSMGFGAALSLAAWGLGIWLMITGFGVVMEMVKMEADKSLSEAQAERQGEMYVGMMCSAKKKVQEIKDKEDYGGFIDAKYRRA